VKSVIGPKKNQIGTFNGDTVRDENGKIIYWVSDGEVFAPLRYPEGNFQTFNKGQFALIGKFDGTQCVNGEEILFEIQK
jgi:hypothetical protein